MLARPKSHAAPHAGFTLVELLVVLAVAAILLSVGVPQFQSFIARARVDASANELQSALQLARSEASRRASTVSIALVGTAGSRDWSGGWRVFADPNGNGSLDAGEDEIRIFPAVQAPVTVMGSAGLATAATFDARGRVSPAATHALAICYDGDPTTARAITISPGGRIRTALDTNGNRIPNKDDGADIASCTNP